MPALTLASTHALPLATLLAALLAAATAFLTFDDRRDTPRQLHIVLLRHIGTLVNQVLQLDASFATKRRRWPWAFFRAGPRRPRRLHVVPPCSNSLWLTSPC